MTGCQRCDDAMTRRCDGATAEQSTCNSQQAVPVLFACFLLLTHPQAHPMRTNAEAGLVGLETSHEENSADADAGKYAGQICS